MTGKQRGNLISRRGLMMGSAAAAAFSVAPNSTRHALAQADERLKRAREKGSVSWYTDSYPESMREALAQTFEKKTGIRISIYGGGGNAIVSRLRTERTAGSRTVDVVNAGDSEVLDGLVTDGILKSFQPEGADAIHPDFKNPKGYYYGLYFWTLVLEYNTRVISKQNAPKTFEDLIDPKFKGKIVTADPARSTGGLGFVKAMVTATSWDWIEKFLRNDPLVMSVTPQIQPMVIRGERPISLMTSQFTSKSIEEGAPVALATEEALFGSPDHVGILTDAPNPDGALLFVEHLLSKEAQEIVRKSGPYSCRVDVAPPFGMPDVKDLKLRFKRAPRLDIPPGAIAERFHNMLRTARQQ